MINSHSFELARKSSAEESSKAFSGKGNPFYGKSHTEETKRLIAESRKHIIIPKGADHWSYGSKWSEETRVKILKSKALVDKEFCHHCNKTVDKGNFKLHHGENCKKNPVNGNIKLGHVSCVYCKMEIGSLGNLFQYHADKCVLSPLNKDKTFRVYTIYKAYPDIKVYTERMKEEFVEDYLLGYSNVRKLREGVKRRIINLIDKELGCES